MAWNTAWTACYFRWIEFDNPISLNFFIVLFLRFAAQNEMNMNFPAELRYTKDHEWIRLEGNIATIGITDFAQRELGDIVYVEVETIGSRLRQELYSEQ